MRKGCIIIFAMFLLVACKTKQSSVQKTNTGKRTQNSTSQTHNRPSSGSKAPQLLEVVPSVKLTPAIILDYIESYKEVAQSNMRDYGIPASITLGQGILESAAGTSPLSKQANNHFGIKCHKDWTGESVKYYDDAKDECFRKYSDPSESFKGHSLFLTKGSRYASLFELEITDYKAWAKGLKQAGYATDPQYPTKLIDIIERFELHKYDNIKRNQSKKLDKDKPQNAPKTEKYIVSKGDTLYSISKKYNITVEELKRQNNIFDNSISIGQTILIQK